MRVLNSCTIALALCFLMAGIVSAEEGNPVPSLELENLNGQNVELEEHIDSDKITVISFWATWCSPCKRELENIYHLLPDWREKYEVEFIAISVDDSRTADNVEPYVNGRGWDFQVFKDQNQDSKRAFNFSNVPYSVIVNKDGIVTHNHSGYSEGDEYVIEEHLEKLQAGIEE